MKEKVIYLLLILLILTSCAGNRKYDDLMQRADSIMNVDDDSAKVAIRMLDGVKSQLPEFTQSQKMRYELLRHKAMNKACITFTSDSVMKEVVDYYENYGSANQRMLANYVLGCVYRDMHEVPLALEYYNKATEQADTTSKDCDYATLFRVYSQMGILFDKQYLPHQELKAFDLAEKYAYLAKDTFNAIVNFQYKGGAYSYLNKQDSVVFINLMAAKLFYHYGFHKEASLALGDNYDYYIDRGDFEQAKKSFESFEMTEYDGNSNYPDAKSYVLCQKGKYYLFTNRLDSAYHYLHESLDLAKTFGNKAAVTKILAQFYSKINQPSLEGKFALMSLEYQDSDFIDARRSQLQQVQAMYDYNRYQAKAVVAEENAIQRTHIIYMLIIGGLVVLMFAFYLYRKNMMFKRKKIEAAQFLYEDCLIQLKRQQIELAKLKKEKNESIAEVVREKEETISKLKEEVREFYEKYSVSFPSEADVLLRNTSIYKKLQYIEIHPKENLEQEDWQNLAKSVEQIIPSFVPVLKEVLSEKEYRVCLLIRLRLPISFVGILVGLSVSGVSAIRKRMLEKLFHKRGKPKDFDDFLYGLS